MYRRYLWGTLALGVVLLTACAASAFAAASKRRLPVLRVVAKSAAGAKSSVVGARGGKLQVRTPGGTTVTLVIPAHALASNTKVILTPLKAVKRVPFRRGIVGAVRLGPEGLILARPAKLVFRPRKPVSRKLQAAFAATGDGHSFHIYPDTAGRTMSVPLMHFSIYGEGEASKQELRGEAGRQQSSARAAIERDLADSASTARVGADLQTLAERVASEVAEALTADSAVTKALDDGLSLAEELRLAGWSSDVLPDMGDQIPASQKRLQQLIDQIRASFPNQVLANALARALDRCESDHSQASRDKVLSILETGRLLGVTDQIDMSLLDRCSVYELEVTSNRSGSSDTTGPAPLYEHQTSSYQHGLHSSVPFALDSGGSGSLDWTAFSDHYESYFPNGSGQCIGTGPETDTSVGQNPRAGSLTVEQMTGDPTVSVTLRVTPASYNLHTTDNSGCGNDTSDDQATTLAGFDAASFSSGVVSTGQHVYKITGWTPGSAGSSVVAIKTIPLSDGTITLKISRR